MRLGELPGVRNWLPNHPLSNDPLWGREAFSVTDLELQLFYARAGTERRREAVDAIDALQAAVISAAFMGDLPMVPAALVTHEPPEEPYFMDEFVASLMKLSMPRRHACLVALELEKPPAWVVELHWKVAKNIPSTPLVSELIAQASRTRHLRLPYVFWEWATPLIAAPLLEFEWSITRAFDCTWPELAHKYRNMILVDRNADAAALLAQLQAI